MKSLLLLAALSASPELPHSSAPNQQMASITCFKKGEQTSGFNKICYYDCLGSAAAITIGATSLCPLTIEQ